MTPYLLSCAKAIHRTFSISELRPAFNGARTAPFDRIRGAVVDLESRLPATHPFTPLCVNGVTVEQHLHLSRVEVKVRLLLRRGWCRAMSLQVYKNFAFAFPQLPFEVDNLRLLDEGQLISIFGYTFGKVLSECIGDPSAQPYLHAMLFREHLLVQPAHVVGLATMAFSETSFYSDSALPPIWLEFFGAPGSLPSSTPTSVDWLTASNIYFEATGLRLEPPESLSPLEVDYEACAKTTEEVRQADGAQRDDDG